MDHRQFTFIDLGSGEGRALMLAARHPFRRIIGVASLRSCIASQRRISGNWLPQRAPTVVLSSSMKMLANILCRRVRC